MSRLGKMPIPLPKGVEVKISEKEIEVKGPKGHLKMPLEQGLIVKQKDNMLFVEVAESAKVEGKTYGMTRAMINNLIIGVSQGFDIKLTLVGVGYRAAVSGTKLDMQLGFSHPTALDIPKDIKVAIDKGTSIVISGIDKQKVGQFASTVRSLKPPEPYKGKGVRYENEYVRKKAGKAAKAATAAAK